MKKILLTIIILTLFTLLGCKSNHNIVVEKSILNYTLKDIEYTSSEAKIHSTELFGFEFSEISDKDVSTRVIPNRTRSLCDSLRYNLTNTYYNDEGEIVIEGNFVNVSDYQAVVISLAEFDLYNENDELIASNAFDYLDNNLNVESGERTAFALTFPSTNVLISDDDLDTVKPVSKFR